MRTLVVLLASAGMLLPTAALAETDAQCLMRWKAADLDANGSFDPATDSKDYAASVGGSGVSRDQFLEMCKAGRFAALKLPDNPAAGRDIGKGDLTAGPPLAEDVARKKLKALGYSDISNLALDDKGIWRGEAKIHDRSVSIAIDPQGDVISKSR
jgi:hypothetical protein